MKTLKFAFEIKRSLVEAAKVWEASYLRVHNAHRARKCFFLVKESLLSQGNKVKA